MVVRCQKKKRYPDEIQSLLVVLLLATFLVGSGSSALSLDTASTSTTIGGGERKVNVLLRVETDDERGNVDDLLANSNVALADQNTGVMDRLCKAKLEDLSLKTALQEILDLQGKDVVQLHLVLVQDTDADQATNQCVTLEQTARVFVLEGQELTGGTANVGESKANAPDLALVAETIFSYELQLLVETGGFKGATGDLVGL